MVELTYNKVRNMLYILISRNSAEYRKTGNCCVITNLVTTIWILSVSQGKCIIQTAAWYLRLVIKVTLYTFANLKNKYLILIIALLEIVIRQMLWRLWKIQQEPSKFAWNNIYLIRGRGRFNSPFYFTNQWSIIRLPKYPIEQILHIGLIPAEWGRL